MKPTIFKLICPILYVVLFSQSAYAVQLSRASDGLLSSNIKLTPNGLNVVYGVFNAQQSDSGLMSVPTNGGTPLPLGEPLRLDLPMTNRSEVILDFELGPNSRRAVYHEHSIDLSEPFGSDSSDLFSVSLNNGRDVVNLANNINLRGDFRISPDGNHVLYQAIDFSRDSGANLYAVPITGGESIKLNTQPIALNGGGYSRFQFSPDGRQVIYLANVSRDQSELFSVPVTGGTSIKLSPPIIDDKDVFISRVQLSSNNQDVVFVRAVRDANSRVETLFSSSIMAGNPVQLNSPSANGGQDIGRTILISPDAKRVIYQADQVEDEVDELFSVPIRGGESIKLNGPLVEGGDVFIRFAITPDSQRVVYLADQNIDQVDELFSVPASGGTATRISIPSTVPNDDISQRFQLAPNGEFVYYSKFENGRSSSFLARAPVSGGASTKLDRSMPTSGFIRSFMVTPNGEKVIYTADRDVRSSRELYRIPAAGGIPTKINAPTRNENEDVSDFIITPNSQQLVHVETKFGIRTLFSTPLQDDSLCFPIVAKNEKIAVVCLL